ANCLGCHAVSSVTGMPAGAAMGPNLTTFGDRSHIAGFLDHTKENLVKWIDDPEEYKPGNLMSGKYNELSDEEISAVADYIMSLSVEQ
ncbi:cytochrome c, partial [Butyricicoccus sp. 1XD8-22]